MEGILSSNCVVCGAYVPEGEIICPNCIKGNNMKNNEKKIEIITNIFNYISNKQEKRTRIKFEIMKNGSPLEITFFIDNNAKFWLKSYDFFETSEIIKFINEEPKSIQIENKSLEEIFQILDDLEKTYLEEKGEANEL